MRKFFQGYLLIIKRCARICLLVVLAASWPLSAAHAGLAAAGDYTVYNVIDNRARAGEADVLVMDFDLPVNNSGGNSIIDDILHYGQGAAGPAWVNDGDSLMSFSTNDYWADSNMDDRYTGNAAHSIYDLAGNYAPEAIVAEGGGNTFPLAPYTDVTNLEFSDSVIRSGSLAIIGLQLFPLTNTNNFSQPGYVYYYPPLFPVVPPITRGVMYAGPGIAIIFDADRSLNISNGDVLLHDHWNDLPDGYGSGFYPGHVFTCPGEPQCGFGAPMPEYLYLSGPGSAAAVIWDNEPNGVISAGDIELTDPSNLTAYAAGYVYACGAEPECGSGNLFLPGDMFADEIKSPPGPGVPDFFYSDAELIVWDGAFGANNGLLDAGDLAPWWQGEAVFKVVSGKFLENISMNSPGLTYFDNRATAGAYDSDEDIIDDIDRSGYFNADALTEITINNNGTCGDADINAIRVWEDGPSAGWDGDEAEIGSVITAPFFNHAITAGGSLYSTASNERRVFVTVDVSANVKSDCTFDVEVITNGLQMASNNDGPSDAPLAALGVIKVAVGGGGAVAPSNMSVVINDGAAATTSSAAALALWSDYASEMIIANNSDFSGAAWEPFATVKAWTLTAGAGVKTVYVRYKSATGDISEVISDTIELTAEEITPPAESLLDHQIAAGVDYNSDSHRWIKTEDRDTVYLLDQNNVRHTYPHYNVWYSYFGNDWSRVEVIAADEIAGYSLGRNVPFNVGILIKNQSQPNVYKIETNAVRRWIVSETAAQNHWGADWALLVNDVSDAFWPDYIAGEPIE